MLSNIKTISKWRAHFKERKWKSGLQVIEHQL